MVSAARGYPQRINHFPQILGTIHVSIMNAESVGRARIMCIYNRNTIFFSEWGLNTCANSYTLLTAAECIDG